MIHKIAVRSWNIFVATMFVFASIPVEADVVTDWNNALLNAIKIQEIDAAIASRQLAILHAAIFDSINGIKRNAEPYLAKKPRPPHFASEVAAANAAAVKVLRSLYSDPVLNAGFTILYAQILADIPRGNARVKGILWGESVADQTLSARAQDGSDITISPPQSSLPGSWMPTPPSFSPFLVPQWGFIKPFTLLTGAQFRPKNPPSLNSAQYAMEFNEVKLLGSLENSTRTSEQTEIALFWNAINPVSHWNYIAQTVAAQKGNNVAQNARLFALLNLALADAGIVAWDAKFTFNFWRPITAIHNANRDDNRQTTIDESWNSLIINPPFPDYVSGHSVFSGAAAMILASFFNSDVISFSSSTNGDPNVTRNFTSFSSAAAEASLSRILGGIHFRSAIEEGINAGKKIGTWTYSHFLQTR